MLPRLLKLVPAMLLLLAGMAAAQTPTDASLPPASVELVVHLANGRIHAGWLAPESNRAALQLETRFDTGRILRRIDWQQVVRVEIADYTCTGVQLRDAWLGLHPDTSKTPRDGRRYGVTGPTPQAVEAGTTVAEPHPVTSLSIDAELARWDAHVESSGLALRIMPCDAAGQLVPSDGTLTIELVALPLDPLDKQPFSRIGYWQQAVRASDFDSRGALYRLPFQAVHPEFAYLPVQHAALHVRLSVPGQGTFEATQDGVCLRPHFTPVRDYLESLQPGGGPRFFSSERTGRR